MVDYYRAFLPLLFARLSLKLDLLTEFNLDGFQFPFWVDRVVDVGHFLAVKRPNNVKDAIDGLNVRQKAFLRPASSDAPLIKPAMSTK
jgi:hypothetical protein